MPELPEVETVRSGLAPFMLGEIVRTVDVKRPNLRFDFPLHFAQRIEGNKIIGMRRKAKLLLFDLSEGETLISHLGMSGTFFIKSFDQISNTFQSHHPIGHNSIHNHVVFGLQNGTQIYYNDPRRFGFMDLWPTNDLSQYKMLQKMGPEPFETGYTLDYIRNALKLKNTPIKSALLDQSIVSGLGNIYVCEALFTAGLHPQTPSARVPERKLKILFEAIVHVLTRAIAAGGSSLKDFSDANGRLGLFQHSFHVYDREGEDCLKHECKGKIVRIVQAGRSSFYCSNCQKK